MKLEKFHDPPRRIAAGIAIGLVAVAVLYLIGWGLCSYAGTC